MKLTPHHKEDFAIEKREVLYQGVFRMVRLTIRHRLYDGTYSESFTREIVERSSASCVLPYDPEKDRVILIEQFRPGAIRDENHPWLIEIPAGIIEKDEEPNEVAIREADEEAHCHIEALHPICEYYASPGASNEYLYLYCGKVNSTGVDGIHGLAAENEDIRVLNVTTHEAFDLLAKGKIKNGPAIVSLLWLQSNQEKLRMAWK
jgi:ADP-ribose pyrophosphatase